MGDVSAGVPDPAKVAVVSGGAETTAAEVKFTEPVVDREAVVEGR